MNMFYDMKQMKSRVIHLKACEHTLVQREIWGIQNNFLSSLLIEATENSWDNL